VGHIEHHFNIMKNLYLKKWFGLQHTV
jgi:hypothetical protein